jgi:mannose-6-phosphate isomerase-like protein (cupin superfamily)
MRRIVTTNVNGRSRVLSNTELSAQRAATLWTATPDNPLGAEKDLSGGLPPEHKGHVTWQQVILPPASVMKKILAEHRPARLDEDGFHKTDSLDFVIILDGACTLALDDEEVVLQPGDVVVQRETNHAWRNENEFPIRLLAFVVGSGA